MKTGPCWQRRSRNTDLASEAGVVGAGAGRLVAVDDRGDAGVLKKAKVKGGDISAVGLSGQMHGSVFLGDGEQGASAGAAVE
jgi:hypothetical protein